MYNMDNNIPVNLDEFNDINFFLEAGNQLISQIGKNIN